MLLTEAEIEFVKSLGGDSPHLPVSLHAMHRLKQRRPDIPFEQAVMDSVHAWHHGVDMSTDKEHKIMLQSWIRGHNMVNFKYVLYEGFLYVFTKTRKLVTIYIANGVEIK